MKNLNNNEQEIPEVQLEEYALKLDAKDFACRSKAKAKPQPRTVPIVKRTWTDVEPGKYSLSDFEISKKLIHLPRHGQHVHREEDGAVQFWRIKENALIGLIASGKHAWQERRRQEKIPVLY